MRIWAHGVTVRLPVARQNTFPCRLVWWVSRPAVLQPGGMDFMSETRTCSNCQCPITADRFRTPVGKTRCRKCRNAWIAHNRKRNPASGIVNGKWKGGVAMSRGYAYVLMPWHDRSNKAGYLKRANWVMEQIIGRPVRRGEIAHHKNEIKSDDSPGNLELMKLSDHMRYHAKKWRAMRKGSGFLSAEPKSAPGSPELQVNQ